ncbi:MAG: Hypothetical protein BHV28_00810 [Candidatus Tokpelaia hoelldobleri]|uniref:Uncharacterized protein n=1 Tax=Candidatus Tokpelaia hoelldobleri TaxID=1902579 RepID=A0A1U9JSG8_9HYPH|nr:MAG: Hypothetical protein BHV28_00810 [Candidatus Tokpelaia hoelldoblerii]
MKDKALTSFLRGRGKNTFLRLSANALGIPLVDEQPEDVAENPQQMQAFKPMQSRSNNRQRPLYEQPEVEEAPWRAAYSVPPGMAGGNSIQPAAYAQQQMQDEPDHGFQGNAYGQPGNEGGLRAAFEALGDDPRLRQPGYMRRMGGTVGAGWGESAPVQGMAGRQKENYMQLAQMNGAGRSNANGQPAMFQPQQPQPLYAQDAVWDGGQAPVQFANAQRQQEQAGGEGDLRAAFEVLGDDTRLRPPGYMSGMGSPVGAGWGDSAPVQTVADSMALGGLPDECAAILRGMGKAAEGE